MDPDTSLSPEVAALSLEERMGRLRAMVLPEILQLELASSPEVFVRTSLAMNASLLSDVQRMLALDPEPAVRSELAKNPSLLSATFDLLAADSEWEVQDALVSNPSLSLPVQERLALDPEDEVRIHLAEHPHLAPAVQALLVRDPSSEVRIALAQSPVLAPLHQHALAHDKAFSVRAFLARSTTLPELHELLVDDPEEGVVASLARNPFLSPSLQVHLSFSPLPFVVHGLVMTATPTLAFSVASLREHLFPALEGLMEDLDPQTWKPLAENWEGSVASLREAILLL